MARVFGAFGEFMDLSIDQLPFPALVLNDRGEIVAKNAHCQAGLTADCLESHGFKTTELSKGFRLAYAVDDVEERPWRKRYEEYYRGTPQPAFVWQRVGDDFELIGHNEAAIDLTQGTIQHIVGIRARDFFKDQLHVFDDLLESIAKGKRIQRRMLYYYQFSKISRWLDVVYQPVLPDIVFVHTRDVTDEVEYLNRLAESERRYRAVVQDQTELVCRWLPDRTLTFVNEAFCRFFGTSEEKCLGSDLLEVAVPAIREAAREAIEQGKQMMTVDNPTRSIEFPAPNANGEMRDLIWVDRAMFDGKGNVVEYQTVGRDVTEHRLAEGRLTAVMNALPDLYFLIGKDGRLLEHQDSAGFGLILPDCDPINGKTYDQCLHPELAQRIKGQLPDMAQSRSPNTFEFALNAKDGQRRWFEARLVQVLGVGVASIVRDISDRHRAETAVRRRTEELIAMTDRLQRAQEDERKRIASELHDEVAQYLTALSHTIEQCERSGVTPDLMDRAKSVVGDLIRKVREVSTGLRSSVLEDLGLEAAVTELAENARLATGLQPHLRIDLGHVELSKELQQDVYRTVQEAVNNVVRHSKATKVKIAIDVGREALAIEVSDDGVGFDPESARDRYEGLGIRGMMERAARWGGIFGLESSPGEGATVRISLPIAKDKRSKRA